MVSGSHTEEIHSTVNIGKLWKSLLDSENLIPKVMSHVVSKVEILSGDGGVGTIKKLHFTDIAPFKFITEKTEVLDHENHIFKYSVVEGGLVGLSLKSYTFEFKFSPGREGGTGGYVTMSYETIGDADLTADEKAKIFQGVLGIVKAVEEYLAANPDSYA